MPLLLDSFWRAVAYCLYPRIIVLSLLPLALLLGVGLGLGWLYWGAALAALAAWLDASVVFSMLWGWLAHLGAGGVREVVAPVLLVLLVTPLLVVLALLLVALLMTPAVLRLVAARRFAGLERRGSGSMAGSLLWSLGHTLVALLALLISLPLWLVPPLILVLPPLIWGWLTYRVMSYDALDQHASADERRTLLRRHRLPLLVIGIVCGYLGAAPALVWASLTLFAVAFPLLIPLGVWIYTLVFAFSSLWFTHYCLAALQAQRDRERAPGAAPGRFEAAARITPTTPALPHEP
ncbi:MAG TPA: EI24 domain-containing protein [Ottowia sp.]|uniref:EI24 domain-containing protein n=1 Tax=Ottowia sp. TaxID=1898956 RepID=UPI002C943187|nr:EI24 domain-containing protein [Ottowia sp.]HMN20804.1 EI24 domain-containing protein [Ottowia sp.]